MMNNKQTNRSIQKSKTISKTNQPGDRNRKKKKKKKEKQLWNTKIQLTKELYTLKNSREQSSGIYTLKIRKNGSVG